MTAKEEDILTSTNLIQQGKVIDKTFRKCNCNRKIKLDELLVGDKNALNGWNSYFRIRKRL